MFSVIYPHKRAHQVKRSCLFFPGGNYSRRLPSGGTISSSNRRSLSLLNSVFLSDFVSMKEVSSLHIFLHCEIRMKSLTESFFPLRFYLVTATGTKLSHTSSKNHSLLDLYESIPKHGTHTFP